MIFGGSIKVAWLHLLNSNTSLLVLCGAISFSVNLRYPGDVTFQPIASKHKSIHVHIYEWLRFCVIQASRTKVFFQILKITKYTSSLVRRSLSN